MPHNIWLTAMGLFLILVEFWGFYLAYNIPIINVGSESEPLFAATTIYGTPTTLSGNTMNLLMSLIGGMAVGYLLSKGSPLWTFSGAESTRLPISNRSARRFRSVPTAQAAAAAADDDAASDVDDMAMAAHR